jgi:tetratricopeptide (TPR) repeat protein
MVASMSSFSSAAVAKRLEQSKDSASYGPFQSRLFQSPKERTLLLCLLLTVVVLVSYSPVTRNGFLNHDDYAYITQNLHVRAGLTWTTVKWAFTTYDQANWHPLTWLSHALDCQLFGLNPAGPHYENVLLHALNVVFVFLLLQRTTGSRWRSLMVAALFALHPINVESVAWAAERKNVLSMLFFLLALHAYVWYTRRPALLRYVVMFFLLVLGFMSKSQVITFPFLLLLWDYWPLRRIGPPAATGTEMPKATASNTSVGWLVLEKVPLLLLSAASAVVTMKAQNAGGAVQSFSQYSLPLRLETAVISYVRYLGKAFWPSKLVALYPHPTKLYPAWQVVAAVVLLLLISAWVLRAREQRYLAVGWFWFLGSLVPMLGLVQVGAQAMADRYAYIPFLGLFLMLTWLVADWASPRKISAAWLAIPAVACLLVLATLTYRQVRYWHDTESFWLRTLALTENNWFAHDTLAGFLSSQGRDEEAFAHYRAALAIWPDDLPANLNMGGYEQSRGNLSAAIERYQRVALHAGDVNLRAEAYGNLGSVYRLMGDPIKAKQCFEIALRLTPDRPMPMAMIGLGLIAEKSGDLPEAVRQYSNAMKVQPTDVGFLLLAHALRQQGSADEANAISDRVVRFSPNLPEAQKEVEALLTGSDAGK